MINSTQLNLPLSKGKLSHNNVLPYSKLEYFEDWAKRQLTNSLFKNADETGTNIGGKRRWLHCFLNEVSPTDGWASEIRILACADSSSAASWRGTVFKSLL